MKSVPVLLMLLVPSFVAPFVAQEKRYICLLDHQVSSAASGSCPVCGFELVAAELAGIIAFTCPDHPEIQQSIPGRCPKCSKKLVPESLKSKPAITYVCPMHPAVTSSFPGKCPRCAMELVDESKLTKNSAAYRCPMDPEVVSGVPAKCAKCGMNLTPVDPAELARFPLELTTRPKSARAGQPIQLRFAVTNPVTRERVRNFDIVHGKPFHLFLVSQDLKFFDHMHPVQKKDGSFIIQTTLPRPAYYRIYADFLPTGGTPQVVQKNLVTSDCRADLFSSTARLAPDKSWTRTVNGMTVALKSDPASFIAGREATLLYALTDANTGAPVMDLQPYLQAWGHTFILNEDGSEPLHSHPTDEIPPEVETKSLRNKPEVSFQAFFPKPGLYRVWSQFQRNNRVSTFEFTIEIHRLR